jgi:hypothetical protein
LSRWRPRSDFNEFLTFMALAFTGFLAEIAPARHRGALLARQDPQNCPLCNHEKRRLRQV